MDDIVALILGNHARIARLFEEMEGAADSPARLAALWTELCKVLLAHLGAFEEVFFLPFRGTVPDESLGMRDLGAQKLDILDAVAEARLRQVGSPLWWLAVRAARAAADRHISSVEASGLSRFAHQTPERTRRELGLQWNRFMADFSSDRLGEARPD